MQLQQIIEKHWYTKNNPLLCLILLPISLIFFLISQTRYYMYRLGILKSFKLPVPVVIVGNISVGGAGKTPLTKHLASELSQRGISVGVILRGYKSQAKDAMVVRETDDSIMVGDEALIYAKSRIKVAIGSNRYHAGLALLKEYPDIQLILTDDGMQHYRLQRDYEIAVIDTSRMLGNRFTLPMGPLRETVARLESVNAVVFNGKLPNNIRGYLPLPKLIIQQTLELDKIYSPYNNKSIMVKELAHKQIAALAGIGNPERFFNFLRNLDIPLAQTFAFPDHYHYKATDIPSNYPIILVTEKDYAKLDKLDNGIMWIVQVKTNLNSSQLINEISNLVTTKSKKVQ